MSRHHLDAQRRSNQERINMVGSSGNPPPERTPLGTVIEVEPEWVCCCCDQEIPRPSGGMSTPVGSFCGGCFCAFIDHLFNKTKVPFLNEIRDQSYKFIEHRRGLIEDGIMEMPDVQKTTIAHVVKGERNRLKAMLRSLICEMDGEDDEELG
jgi:hypothetical protein